MFVSAARGKTFTLADSLRRHERQSCRIKTLNDYPPFKKIKVDGDLPLFVCVQKR